MRLLFYLIVGLVLACGAVALGPTAARAGPPEPGATPDRLATPVLSANPSPVELGARLYYDQCMPCHGDRGQGLTDEWRAVWVEDHQDCWARGCHAGRSGDEGFPIPRAVPPVAGVPGALARFGTPDELYRYLRETQPPQEPGRLSAAQYQMLTAYLLELNGRATKARPANGGGAAAAGTLMIAAVFAGWLLWRAREQRGNVR